MSDTISTFFSAASSPRSLTTLDDIRNCLEGIVPAGFATCDAEGMPNVTMVSQAIYVDKNHLALSFQFFNKTRENILVNPVASVLMMDSVSAARYRLTVRYLKTETSGPLFEKMRAKLAGIASHEGMEGVFKLRGADIYHVLDIEHLPGRELPTHPTSIALLPALRRSVDALQVYHSLEQLVDCLLDALDRFFEIRNSMLLMVDRNANKLYTLASRGYARSGIGAEIPIGVGVIGVAAQHCVPIRIMFAATEFEYNRAIGEQALRDGLVTQLEAAIPMPGLASPASQMAVPVMSNHQVLAVLYVESEQVCQFGYDMEDVMVALCAKVGEAMRVIQLQTQTAPDIATLQAPSIQPLQGPKVVVKYYARDHSIFLDEEYLIKGVAGAILWYLLDTFIHHGRVEFSNRELRLAPHLPLPDIADNLDARLLLLARRLQERSDVVQIEKTGRGRFRLILRRPLTLQRY